MHVFGRFSPGCHALALALLIFGHATGADIAVRMAPENDPDAAFFAENLSADALAQVKALQAGDEAWSRLFAVRLGGVDADGPPILGKYQATDSGVRFQPRFPLQKGETYGVVFDPAVITLEAAAKPVTRTFTLAAKSDSRPTEAVAIYPSSNALPENLLRMYLHFSAPMSQGDSYRYLTLQDEAGEAIELPFLELPQELWNETGTRLTILFDPGRVKQGLKPREESGPVLVPNRRYTLVIDSNWPDADGNPLKAERRKEFTVVDADVTQPDPSQWEIFTPQAGTTEGLTIRFPDALDHGMLHRSIRVIGPDQSELAGEIELQDEETLWRFVPDASWNKGTHRLAVATVLEDRAGNSIGRPFEVDLTAKRDGQEEKEVRLSVEIKDPDDMTFAEKSLRYWHQWRGPEATGLAPLGDPPVRWSETENVRWKTPIPGAASATPIVWENKLFLVSAERTDRKADQPPQAAPDARTTPPDVYYRFWVYCLDRETGDVLWKDVAVEAVPHEGLHQTNTYAAASPTTDGRLLYVSFGSRGIYCYDLDGKQIWKRDIGRMRTRLGWGEGVSPTVHDGHLIVPWDHEGESKLFVLDARTGETKWDVDRDEPSAWATPLVVEHGERTQVVVNATRRVRSYDLDTGEIIWECAGQTVNVIPSPVRFGNVVICMSGYRGHTASAISLNSRGDVTGTDNEIWRIHRNTPYVPSPLLYRDLLYFTRTNTNVMSCLEATTGQTVIAPERLPEVTTLYASPAAAPGRIYFTDRNGVTTVIKAGREFETIGVNRLEEPIDASPVIVGKQLFLRSHDSVYCIQE